jgi:GNAT superfamily N-acetyltransferase
MKAGKIRKYREKDRKAIRDISVKTSFLGNPIEFFVNDKELIADVLTRFYTDYEPESCFVAILEGEVIGYITGATNVRRMRSIFRYRIMPAVMKRGLGKKVFMNRNTLKYFFPTFISFLKGEFSTPDFSVEYPATLHVNVVEDYRGIGIGRRLIREYLDYLEQFGISGVHFRTKSEKAKVFFQKLGFNILYKGKFSYMRYYMGQDMPYYIFGKKLDDYNR